MENRINLIRNLYTSKDAHEIIMDFLNYKINFIRRKIFSLEETGQQVPERLNHRLETLRNERERIKEYFDNKTNGTYLEIECEIRLKELAIDVS